MATERIIPGEIRIFLNHIYEFKKGVRNMVLYTMSKEHEEFARQRLGEQGAGFRLQLDGCTGAAVAPVVPFQADDAAAGTQICRALEPLWLGKAGQQQRV